MPKNEINLTWAEEVRIICRPHNVAVTRAWDKYVKAAGLATNHNITALRHIKSTIHYAELTNKHISAARLLKALIG